MQILIGCSKTMTQAARPRGLSFSTPAFRHIANELALQMTSYTPAELQQMLKVNPSIARDTWRRYHDFHDPATLRPALWAYDGMVFKKIAPAAMTPGEIAYADSHIFIASFLYGLLRPLDLINPYRLEGNVSLPATGHNTISSYWRPLLTDTLIKAVNDDDGILVNLASNEFTGIFDWKRVMEETTVVTPQFKIDKGGRLTTIVIYAKMCRGAMTRWIVQHRPGEPEALRTFEYDGFRWTREWNYILTHV